MPVSLEYATTLNAEQATIVCDNLIDAGYSFACIKHPEREDFYNLLVPLEELETVKEATKLYDPFENDEGIESE